jgi:uncharacterized protein (TIGR02284 family)
MVSKDVVTLLNDLIATSKDGEKGFMEAAHLARDPNLKTLLQRFSNECGEAARELQACAVTAGGFADNTGSTAGAVHREWMNIKAKATPNNDKAVLQECERGEDRAKATYEKVLKIDLPTTIRTVVQRQYEGTLQHHNRIRTLRDQFEETS